MLVFRGVCPHHFPDDLIPNNPFPQDAANCGIAFAAAKMSPEHIVTSLQLSKYGEVWTNGRSGWMLDADLGESLKDANLGLRKMFVFFLNNDAFLFCWLFLLPKFVWFSAGKCSREQLNQKVSTVWGQLGNRNFNNN